MPIVVLNVDESNPEKFNEFIMRQPCVVRFHMEGCSHCIAMEPAWNYAIEELKARPDLEGGIIDFNSRAMPHAPPLIKAAVKGFPTIISLDSDGNIVKIFDGPRDHDTLKQFSEDHLKTQKKHKKHKKSIKKLISKKHSSHKIVSGGKKKTKRRNHTKSRKRSSVRKIKRFNRKRDSSSWSCNIL
tara:strand:- start:395 stop:949 length:555 start_codon:yes stop_codon:yes gene_type:complete